MFFEPNTKTQCTLPTPPTRPTYFYPRWLQPYTHTQIKFPTADELRAAAAAAEGRGKDKKHHGYIMIPLLLGSTIIPIAYGALALLAGKALIVSKLALVLASIIGIKKLVSHSSDSGGGSRRIATDEAETAEWSRKFELPQSVLQQS